MIYVFSAAFNEFFFEKDENFFWTNETTLIDPSSKSASSIGDLLIHIDVLTRTKTTKVMFKSFGQIFVQMHLFRGYSMVR